VKFFTVYIDRDVRIEATGDGQAVELARRLHDGVDRLIAELDGAAECSYARSTCHRGIANKMLLDEERGEVE
jgi:hypothetical protein